MIEMTGLNDLRLFSQCRLFSYLSGFLNSENNEIHINSFDLKLEKNIFWNASHGCNEFINLKFCYDLLCCYASH